MITLTISIVVTNPLATSITIDYAVSALTNNDVDIIIIAIIIEFCMITATSIIDAIVILDIVKS